MKRNPVLHRTLSPGVMSSTGGVQPFIAGLGPFLGGLGKAVGAELIAEGIIEGGKAILDGDGSGGGSNVVSVQHQLECGKDRSTTLIATATSDRSYATYRPWWWDEVGGGSQQEVFDNVLKKMEADKPTVKTEAEDNAKKAAETAAINWAKSHSCVGDCKLSYTIEEPENTGVPVFSTSWGGFYATMTYSAKATCKATAKCG